MFFIPYVIAGAAGAWAASRGRPNTSVKKRCVLGTKTGLNYEVDDLKDSSIVIVHSPPETQKAVGTFRRKDLDVGGFEWVGGTGDREVLALMIKDFL